MDLGGKSIIRNINREDEQCVLEYHKRGWTGSDAFKVDGKVLSGKKEVAFNIEGKWSDKIYLVNPKNKEDRELVF